MYSCTVSCTIHVLFSYTVFLLYFSYYFLFHVLYLFIYFSCNVLCTFHILSILFMCSSFMCSSFMPVNTKKVDTGLYVPGGTIIIAQDNNVYGRSKRGRYVSTQTGRCVLTQTGPLCVDPNGASILTQTGALYYMLQTYSLNGMPIYPSTWSDTGNQFYYIFCTYLISMNNYCYHDFLCNIYYHYFNLYSFSYL